MTVKPAARHYKYITAVKMFLSQWANTKQRSFLGGKGKEGSHDQYHVQGEGTSSLEQEAEPSTKYFLGDIQRELEMG